MKTKTTRPTAAASPGLHYLGEVARAARRAAEAQYQREREAKAIEENTLLHRCEQAVHWALEGLPDIASKLSAEQVAGISRGLARALVSTAGR